MLFVCSVTWLFFLGCQYQYKWLSGKTPLRVDPFPNITVTCTNWCTVNWSYLFSEMFTVYTCNLNVHIISWKYIENTYASVEYVFFVVFVGKCELLLCLLGFRGGDCDVSFWRWMEWSFETGELLALFSYASKTVKLIAFTVFCIYHKSCLGCVINVQCVYWEHQKSSP